MKRSRQCAAESPRWKERAACRPHPTWWWFTEDVPEAVEAFVICTGCPVRGQCLAFALAHAELTGIWAATTDRDRARLRRARR